MIEADPSSSEDFFFHSVQAERRAKCLGNKMAEGKEREGFKVHLSSLLSFILSLLRLSLSLLSRGFYIDRVAQGF